MSIINIDPRNYIKELKNKFNEDKLTQDQLFDLVKRSDNKLIGFYIKELIDILNKDYLYELAKLSDKNYIHLRIKQLKNKLTTDQLLELAKLSYDRLIYECIGLLIDKLTTDQLVELAKLSYKYYIYKCILLIDKLSNNQLLELAKLTDDNSAYHYINKLIKNCKNKLTQDQLFELAKLSNNFYKCILLLKNKLTPDKLFELAKLSHSWYIKDCIGVLRNKLTQDQLFELAKLSNEYYIKSCIKILINKLTKDQLLKLAKLSSNKSECLDFIRINILVSINELIDCGFAENLENNLIYKVVTQQVYPKTIDKKPEFKNKLDKLTWQIHVGHIEASAYGAKVVDIKDNIFDFIESKQNTTEDKSNLNMISLLYELIYKDRKINYDDATELKSYLDYIREQTNEGIIKLSIK